MTILNSHFRKSRVRREHEPLLATKGPRLDQMMRDCDWRWHSKTVHLLSLDQLAREATLQPSHFCELVFINLGVATCCLREASNHQRRRKRPRLRGVVSDLADFHRRF